MATQITIHKNGLTVLYEDPQPTVDLVFVHGFTGHPKDTWTWKRARDQSAEREKKHDRNEQQPLAWRFKIPRWSLGRSSRDGSTVTCSNPQDDQKETADSTSGRNVAEPEGLQEEVYWPVDLARQTIPSSRILTYGYDTNIRHRLKGGGSKNTLSDHAMVMLCTLEALRRKPNESSRPVLFVAHSLGGLVVKQALRMSKGSASTKKHLHGIFEATIGVLFFGTPHRGADPLNFVRRVATSSARVVGFHLNSRIIKTLLPASEQLGPLRVEFSQMCHEQKWRIYSFQEQLGVTKLMGTKIVDDDSSCLDDPIVETKLYISSDHMAMCRFYGLQDPEYSKVAAAMTLILGNIHNSTHTTSHRHHEQPLAHAESQHASVLHEESNPEPSDPGIRVRDDSSPPETQPRGEGRSARDGIDAALKDSLVELLFFSKIDERLTSLAAAQGKTCRWFLSKREYTAWRETTKQSDDGGFLWIKGNPGTGKSTLMKLLFEEARGNAKGDDSQITLSFFFLAHGTIEEKSTIGLYRSLLHQLLGEAVDMRDSLDWMTAYGARGILKNGWNEEALKQTLTRAVSRLEDRSLMIFVDALDECDQSQAAGMVCFFEELCDHAREAGVRLRICFSSRHYPTITIEKGVEVTLDAEAGHTDDIKHYIKSKLRLGKSTHAGPLQSEILQKSSGIFLWVVLVVGILNKEYPNSSVSIGNIRKRLEQIPPGLDDLFEVILTRDKDNLEQLDVCLKLVLYAARPLRAPELYFAVHLGLDKESSSYWDHKDIELDQIKTFVRTCSKGLAEVTRTKSASVQFIHESVRDFLLGRYRERWSGTSGNFEGHCHDRLKDCCLAQLNAPIHLSAAVPNPLPLGHEAPRLSKYFRQTFPFLEYSVLYALRHANSAQQHGVEQGDFLTNFPLLHWVTLSNALETRMKWQHTRSVDLLYILAEQNLADLIRIHPRPAACFNAGEERFGPPISAALALRKNDAVDAILESLLARAEQPDSPPRDLGPQCGQNYGKQADGGRGFTFTRGRGIVSYLSERGNEAKLLAWLSSERVDVDARSRKGRTPLTWAACSGHETVVRLLLNTGQVEVDAKDNLGLTPLSLAVLGGHEAVVQLLLNTSQVEVDAKNNRGEAPLFWAAQHGHEAVVQQLLNTGKVEVDAKSASGQTPFEIAAAGGHEAVVRLLLGTGEVEIDVKDIGGRTPLWYASASGHEAVVRLLLGTGQVEIDAKDNHSWTPLSYANERGHTAVVMLLE